MKTTFVESNNFEIVGIDEPERWNEIIGKFKNIDTYYTPGYVKSFMVHGDGEPILFHYNNGSYNALNVVMLRRIKDINYIILDSKEEYFDLSTPYGYGGFIFDDYVDQDSLNKLNHDYISLCKNNNIICEFVRFHPILRNYELVSNMYETKYIGDTIVMDLNTEEDIWNNITSKNRNVIRKAIKNHVVIKHGLTMDLFLKFIELYNSTMDRDNAREYYYFEIDFYRTLYSDLNQEIDLFYAENDNNIISMAIILKRNKQLHYHLSGSDVRYKSLAANNLLIWEVAKWGCQNGYKTFHLGGGVGGNEQDTLFKFKKSFNRCSDSKFFIGKKIFNKEIYDKLLQSINENIELDYDFFPAYRSGKEL